MIAIKEAVANGFYDYYSKLFTIKGELIYHCGPNELEFEFVVTRNADDKEIERISKHFRTGDTRSPNRSHGDTAIRQADDFIEDLKAKHILDWDSNFLIMQSCVKVVPVLQ